MSDAEREGDNPAGAAPTARLVRLGPGPEPAARPIVLDLDRAAPQRAPAPVFETLRLVELRLLRMALGRKLAHSPRWLEADGARAAAARAIVALVDELGAPPMSLLPEVAVVHRTGQGVIERVFSVVNGAVFLSAARCGEWREGREDAAFLAVLGDALRLVHDERLFQLGARRLGASFQNGGN